MKSKDEISKGPKKRDPASYQVLRDIVIPAGTILRSTGQGRYSAGAAGGVFSIDECGPPLDPNFRKVIAA